MDAPWRIELLGWLRATQGDHVVSRFRSQKVRSLLAFLAYHNHRSHPRETLIELLWPECDPAAGRQRLRQALHLLRHQLEPPGVPEGAVILANHTAVQLNPAACITDVAEFEAALQSAARAASSSGCEQVPRLIAAVELYRGELLPGCFEDWVLPERQRLSEAYLHALDQLVGLLEQTGDPHGALQYARRAVAADSLREETHHTLIRLLVATGQPEAALRQYHELERLMARELGTTPAPETRALVAEIRSGMGAEVPPAARGARVSASGHLGPEAPYASQPLSSVPSSAPVSTASTDRLPAREGHLPLQLTRFFGRGDEIARLRELLQGETADSRRNAADGSGDSPSSPDYRQPSTVNRLLTLTGPGGSGKTRLAIQAAQQLRPAFAGGVWFVPLLDLVDPGLIPDQILTSLRLPRSPSTEPLEQVLAFLSSRPSLLVLDNFEHLVPGGADLAKTLLESVETLSLLITSRQRLDLPGEREFPLPPLPVPVDGPTMTDSSDPSDPSELSTLNHQLSTLAACPSVALFLDRAQAVRPDFQLTKANDAAVASLCARLEGLPLALELAAARVGMLTPAQMLARLEQRFELLVSRQRGADPRHRSLRAALDWSYQLLSPDLQRFFAQLSVFHGGWTLEAAEAVCQHPHALDYLSQLRECSMLLAEDSGGEMRYRFLETLREYARERLQDAGEGAVLLGQHRDFFLALAERAEPELRGPRQAEWIDRLEAEHPNLRAALEWCHREEIGSEAAFRLAVALGQFWKFRCSLSEGRQQLAPLLGVIGTLPPTAAQAKLLHLVGVLARWQGDYAPARALLEQSVVIGQELEDHQVVSDALAHLGGVAKLRGDYEAARAFLAESLAAARKGGYQAGIAQSLEELARVAHQQGQLNEAYSLSMESLAIAQQLKDLRQIAISLQNLGEISHLRGDFTKARAFLQQALEIYQRLGAKKGAGYALGTLGLIALAEEDIQAARDSFRKSLSLFREISDKDGVATCLEEQADLATREGRLERSAQLLAAAAAVLDAMGAPRAPAYRAEHERRLAALRGSLGEEAFAAAWAEGQAMTMEQAAIEALAEMRAPPSG